MSVELGTARAAPGLRLGRLTWTPLGTGGGGARLPPGALRLARATPALLYKAFK